MANIIKVTTKKIKILFVDLEIFEPLFASEFFIETYQLFLDYMELINVRLIAVILILLVIPVTLLAVRQEQTIQQHAGVSKEFSDLVTFTASLRSLNNQFKQSPTNAIANQMLATAVLREQSMFTLIQTNPEKAIQLALSEQEKNSYPINVRNHIEDHVTLSGRFYAVAKSPIEYYIQTSGDTYRIFFPQAGSQQFISKNITITGIRVLSRIAISDAAALK